MFKNIDKHPGCNIPVLLYMAVFCLGLMTGTGSLMAEERHVTQGGEVRHETRDGEKRNVTQGGEERHETRSGEKRHVTQGGEARNETRGGEKRHVTD